MQNPNPDQPRRGAQAQQASAYSRKERNLDLYGPLGTDGHRLFGSTTDSENGRDYNAIRRKGKDNCCAVMLSREGYAIPPTLSDDDGSSLLTADECAPVTGQLSISTLSDCQGKRSEINSVATSMYSYSTSSRRARRTLSHMNSSWLVLQDRLRHSESSSSFGGGEEPRYHSRYPATTTTILPRSAAFQSKTDTQKNPRLIKGVQPRRIPEL